MRAKVAVIVMGAWIATAAHATGPKVREKEIKFPTGETSATMNGKLKGDEIIDYKVRAIAGQSMLVVFRSGNPSAYFNVLPPDGDAAIFIGSTSGNRYEGAALTEGTYTVRVYLMRNAARRNETANYALDVGVSGGSKTAETGPSAGQPPAKVDASGIVKCSTGGVLLDQQCAFRVVRDLPRKVADVWVARPGTGATPSWRFLRYAVTAFTTAGPGKIDARRIDDNWLVGIDGTESYLLPDALLHGG
jgi:hypothetical protein